MNQNPNKDEFEGERVGGTQFNVLCRMPDGSDVRVWFGKFRGSQRVFLGVKNSKSLSAENYGAIVRKLREVALSCPFVCDHAHEPSGDGVNIEAGIPVNQVEIKKRFNLFIYDLGRALRAQGFMPREGRLEPTIIGSVAVTLGELLQRAIDE